MNFLRTRRARLWAVAAIFVALIVTFPLSVAFSLFGLKDMGVTARSLRGPVWWGGAEELTVGGIRLGTVNVFLNPLPLFIGRANVSLIRANGKPDDFLGGLTIGPGVRGFDRVTGSLALGATLAPLPVSRATFEKFTGQFAAGRCSEAEGRVRVQIAALIPGLNLANGLSGDARCDGDVLLIPLASQSGQEKLDLRVHATGAYEAVMRIRTSDPALTGALAANGFQLSGGEQMLRVAGTL